jgi:predicted dehydrogenase
MINGKIGVGIVGLSANGGWAANAHLPAIRALSDEIAVVGLSASSPASARAAAERHEVPFHTDDARTLAERSDIDVVVVAVKVPHHRELVEAAVGAGKTVYCEWPLARDVDEAADLVALVQARGVRNVIGLQARSAPSIRFLRDLIADGHIGTVLSTTVIGSSGPPWGGVATSASAYATDRDTGASMLTVPFGHTIDALAWVLGDFVTVRPTVAIRRPEVALSDTGAVKPLEVADQIAVTGLLREGAVASMHYRGGLSRGTNFHWEINGADGDIVVSGGIGHIQFGGVTIQAASGSDAVLRDVAVPERYYRVDANRAAPSHVLAHVYRALVDDIRDGTSQLPDFDDAIRLHRLLAAIENKRGLGTVMLETGR